MGLAIGVDIGGTKLAAGVVDDQGRVLVTMGAIAGDPVALESFKAVGAWLGHGMADLAALLDPRVFIIGGEVSEAGELLVGPARESFQGRSMHRKFSQED